MKKNFIKTEKDVINLEISGLIKLAFPISSPSPQRENSQVSLATRTGREMTAPNKNKIFFILMSP